MGRIWIACGTLIALSGCRQMLRPEWEPEIRPCQVWIYDAQKRTAVCVDRPTYEEWAKRTLPPGE